MTNNKLNSSRGITIIELLLVILLISTLGVMSISFYARFLTQNSVDNVTTQLVNSLRKAQIYSMTGKQNGIWGVKYITSPKKITLYLTGNSSFDESFALSSNITIDGFTDLSFAKVTGLPVPPGTYTITVNGDSNSKTINVNNQGVVGRQ